MTTIAEWLMLPADQIPYRELDDALVFDLATQREEPFIATSALGELAIHRRELGRAAAAAIVDAPVWDRHLHAFALDILYDCDRAAGVAAMIRLLPTCDDPKILDVMIDNVLSEAERFEAGPAYDFVQALVARGAAMDPAPLPEPDDLYKLLDRYLPPAPPEPAVVVQVRAAPDGKRFATWSRFDGGPALIAAVESDGRDSYAPDALGRLLADARASAGANATPAAIAGALDRALRGARGAQRPSWLLFAAARLGAREVEVCTAGTLRVHLVRRGAIVAVTRDHIWREDPAYRPPVPAAMAATMATVVTRSLGGTGKPETVRWPVDGSYQVVIATADFHRHRPPADYASELAAIVADPSHALGDDDGVLVIASR